MRSQAELLQAVAVRIVSRYLEQVGYAQVQVLSPDQAAAVGADLSYLRDGALRTAKIKADPYFGADPSSIADRSLPFYRADTQSYALETICDAATRVPGWALSSPADELLYLFLASRATEGQLEAALLAPDDVFFGKIAVERDELHVLPLPDLREWLASVQESFPARPVTAGVRASWVRLVPTADVLGAGLPVRVVGSVLARARGEA